MSINEKISNFNNCVTTKYNRFTADSESFHNLAAQNWFLRLKADI